ncbi:protein MOS2 [Humulus lupulus]|uniref:protein MOS2 n=1 Tax=Humulus lupulus TaxID=3486 RepID=UPI002B4049CB|nr:protein MOS2 [Humulus lupulus]
MKLSFSLPSKTNSKSNSIKPSNNFGDDSKNSSNAEDSKKFVTEFNASEIITDNDRRKDLVIPPIQNEWEPRKKMKIFELPIVQSDGSGGLNFEVESLSAVAEANDSKMSYGLNLRKSTKGAETDSQDQVNGSDSKSPEMEPSRIAPSAEDGLLQKLKYDLQRLPEDQGMEEFADMPVEGFGAALLAGYGWYEGRGIGKNAKEDVKVVEYHKRTDKRGLGFVNDDVPTRDVNPTQKSNNKGKENDKEKKKEKGRGDRDREREGATSVEKDVRIVGGRNAGLKGRIVEKLGHDRLVVRLSRSEELVTLQVGDVAELGSKEEERCLKRLKELKIKERGLKRVEESRSQDRSEIKASKPVREEGRRDSKSLNNQSRNSSSMGQISWLCSHIRVRIISRDLKGGRLYLKKGKVVDVVSPRICDISMDESNELIRGVSQDLLETALPRRGGPVLVLFGKHKGVYGSLVERDLDRETGVVRDADTHALHNVHLEQVAEYIGDPSYLGY